MEKTTNVIKNRMVMILINVVMLILLISTGVYASTSSSGTESSNFSIQNVITSVKSFEEAGKKTDGGIDAKAMGDKFAEQLKPIGDLIISVGMIVCVAVTIIFGMKFIAASRKRTRNCKVENTIFRICNCIFNICICISYMEFYSTINWRYGSKSIIKIGYLGD